MGPKVSVGWFYPHMREGTTLFDRDLGNAELLDRPGVGP
jgi:hypothetical protein